MVDDTARPPWRPPDPGDAWATGAHGRFWGRFGAAGLLAWDPARGVLLQHRVHWSDHGGTWGIPGGALHQGEGSTAAALREAQEEAGVPPTSCRVVDTHIFDVGYWRYTTVVALVVRPFTPFINDPESVDLQWVPTLDVATLALHPGFAEAWPRLRKRLKDDG